jgi:hypothetical protein
MKRILFLASLIAFMLSCKKAEDRSCFKSTGDDTERVVDLPEFSKLKLYKNLRFHLIQDTANYAVVKGGGNLINLVTFSMEDDFMAVHNENQCNFLRSYDRIIEVELHFKSINFVDFYGSQSLTNADTIRADFFNLYIDKGAGSVTLTIDADYANGNINEGAGDYTLKGKILFGHFQIRDNGFADVTKLDIAEGIEISTWSTGTIKCRVNQIPLKVNIYRAGDVWYYGNPSSITLHQEGTGKLIAK